MHKPGFRHIVVAIASVAISLGASAEKSDSISYKPNFHATLRQRLEMSTEDDAYHFQMRNARMTIDGFVAPAIDYFVQVDVCDCGTVKFLDGWMRLAVTDKLKFQAGQFRMPFGVEPFRAPHTYFFANRSFIGKQVFNYRAVGAKLCYGVPKLPLTIEAGVFNTSKIGDHTPWNHSLAFGSKALYNIGVISLTAGFASISPSQTRINVVDGAVTLKAGRWNAAAEYMNMHYARRDFSNTQGYLAFVDYRMPVKLGMFNRLSFQGRFDGMTALSNGTVDDKGNISTTTPARNRITAGATVTYLHSNNRFLDIRANYEKYFYHSGVSVTPDMGDRVVLEMVLRF